MEARYRYRLRVSDTQARQLQEVFDSCRFVWNTALGRWGDLWRHEQVSLSYVDMAAELTDWRGRYDWLAALPVTPQQQVLRDLGRAVAAFYDKNNPAGLNRSIADAGWAQFLAVLAWQARKAGHQVVALNPSGTTQTCSRCAVKAKRRVGLADRVFCCEDCGLVEHRDRNAARNLNPDRWDKTVRVGQGVDGTKTKTSAERPAA